MGMQVLDLVKAAARQHCKQALTPEEFYQAIQQISARQLQGDALGNTAAIGMTGLGVGAGARGLLGLLELGQRKRPHSPQPSTIELPAPEKQATLAGFLRGDYAKTPMGIPWAVPAAVTAGAGGLYGGWKGIDWILNKQRKQDLDSQLEQSKRDYEQALSEPAAGVKSGAAAELAMALTQLAEEVEKRADLWNTAGAATGIYATAAGAAALGSGLLAYQYGRKRQRMALMNKAYKQLQRKRFAAQPPALFVRHSPGEAEMNNDLFAEA